MPRRPARGHRPLPNTSDSGVGDRSTLPSCQQLHRSKTGALVGERRSVRWSPVGRGSRPGQGCVLTQHARPLLLHWLLLPVTKHLNTLLPAPTELGVICGQDVSF